MNSKSGRKFYYSQKLCLTIFLYERSTIFSLVFSLIRFWILHRNVEYFSENFVIYRIRLLGTTISWIFREKNTSDLVSLIFIITKDGFSSESAIRFSNLQISKIKILQMTWNLNSIQFQFRFQAQDGDLEHSFFRRFGYLKTHNIQRTNF